MFIKTKNQILDVVKKLNENSNDFTSNFISPAWYTIIKTSHEKYNKDLNKLLFSSWTNNFLNLLWFYDNREYNISKIKRSKILPLKTINSQDWTDIDNISNEFYEILNEFLWYKNIWLTKNITCMIWELLNNISNHSWKSDLYDNTWEVTILSNYQSGQYYKKNNFIQISIVDSWKWILSSVRKKLPDIQNTEEAIKKALEPWFTWWTTLNDNNKNYNWTYNAWIWLTTTLDIIKKLGWDLFIWTKDCLYCYNWKKWDESFLKMPNWVWTFVVFNIYTDNVLEIDFSELRKQLLNDSILSQDFDLNIDFW